MPHKFLPTYPDLHHRLLGAEAAEAAGAQGWFWEMHNLIFECQHEHGKVLTLDLLLALASHLPLNQEEFRNQIEDHRHCEKIEADVQQALKCSVQQAPAFFINGTRYSGSLEYDELVSSLNLAAGL